MTLDESTEPKVLALGPTLDSLASLDSLDARLDAEALEGPGGESMELNVLGHSLFIRFITFGPRVRV